MLGKNLLDPLDRLAVAVLAWTFARMSAHLAPRPRPIPYRTNQPTVMRGAELERRIRTGFDQEAQR